MFSYFQGMLKIDFCLFPLNLKEKFIRALFWDIHMRWWFYWQIYSKYNKVWLTWVGFIFGLANTKQQVFLIKFVIICSLNMTREKRINTEINLILSFVSFDVVLLFGGQKNSVLRTYKFRFVSFALSKPILITTTTTSTT